MKTSSPCLWLVKVLVLVVVRLSSAAHDPNLGSIDFFYDTQSHYIVMQTRSTCFCTLLNHEESDHVLTTTGSDDLKIKFMREWLGLLPEVRLFHDDPAVPSAVLHWCDTRDIFYLNRNIPALTSQSPLVGLLGR